MAGQPITLVIPSVGTAGTTYASQINTALSTLEIELERKVTPGDMNISADLSFLSGATNYAIDDVKLVGLSLQSEATLSAAAFPMALFAGSSDGELYFNDNSGRQVQLTTNGTVNVSSTGGITGAGYGASGIEVNWDGTLFHAYSAASTYADLRIRDLLLDDGSSNRIRLEAPAMSSDYTLTLPAAVAAADGTLLQMSVAGAVTASSASLASISLTANNHVTVSGTGTFKHGDRTLVLPMVGGSGDGSIITNFPDVNLGIGEFWAIPLPLQVGWAVSSIKVYLEPAGTTGKVISVRSTQENGTNTTIATRTVTSASESDYDITGAAFTVEVDKAYYVQILAGDAGDKARIVAVTYNQP